jgi:thioredoxin-dependent peroxiredoxin
MIELGQLERRHEDFAKRNTRVIAISVEGTDDAGQTQTQFPHLLVLADQGRGLSHAVDLIHPHAAPDGSDADAPTTILVGNDGIVLWLYRSPQVIARLSPDDVLHAIDEQTRIWRKGNPDDQ